MKKAFKSEQNWIVEVDEQEWFGATASVRENALAELREQAAKENCTTLTVFAHPDPILPVYGIDRRTKVHGEKLSSDRLYEVCITYHAELAPAAWSEYDPCQRAEALRGIRDELAVKGRRNPGRYEIFLTGPSGVKEYIERGRV